MDAAEERLTETKPFFLTSEFLFLLVALGALAITAVSDESFGAMFFWPLATAIVVAYIGSRGLGKANAPSRSFDPRERWRRLSGSGEDEGGDAVYDDQKETIQMSQMSREEYGQMRPMYRGYGGNGMMIRPQYPIETKPFFLTSEFWGGVIAIVGIAITAASSDAFGSWRAWILITAVVVGYQLSRGIAKSGTKSRSWDPREELMEKGRERMARVGSDGN
jgi:hypothetical protein